jgi:hypothetical protein
MTVLSSTMTNWAQASTITGTHRRIPHLPPSHGAWVGRARRHPRWVT